MVKEIFVKTAFGIETPPDSDPLIVLDAYGGCQFNCPYCFQENNLGKDRAIDVKLNIVDVLEQELKKLSKNELIFLGSESDPFMSLEKKYQLSRRCLELLNQKELDVIITTKADTKSIMSNIDLFRNWKGKLQILVGFSNFNHYLDDIESTIAVETVEQLTKENIEVKAFITPVLPGITDVKRIISKLDPKVPVFIDKLRIFKHNREAIISYIAKNFPDLLPIYKEIADSGIDNYYSNLCNDKAILERCTFTFPDSKI